MILKEKRTHRRTNKILFSFTDDIFQGTCEFLGFFIRELKENYKRRLAVGRRRPYGPPLPTAEISGRM